jgi:hypothetical protein
MFNHDTFPERAPYALPPGTRALESDPTLGRRALLVGAASAGLLSVLAATWLPATLRARAAAGGDRSAAEDTSRRERLAWARELATGDLGALIAAHDTFLSVLARWGSREPELWLGWRRLAQAAIERETMPERRRLARLLLQRVADAPADVRAALGIERAALEEIIR